MSSPLVTIIIPCFNRARFIEATVRSALSQTYRNIEIIAIDDGSTDNSLGILERFSDRVSVLRHPGGANRGQSASINLGLMHSRGRYVAILDSDDLWRPDKLERQVAYLDAHPEVGLVYANGAAVDAEGHELYQLLPTDHVETNDAARVLLDCYFCLPSSSLVRRQVYERIGQFDETLRSAQDHDMAVRIAEVTRLGYIEEKLWFYRKHDQSISLTRTRERWENGFNILAKARSRGVHSKQVLRRRAAVLNFRLGEVCISERRLCAAVSHFVRAAALDPLRTVRVIAGIDRVG